RTTGDVSGRLSLCSVIEKILKKICICQKPRIPGKEGYKDSQDPGHPYILFFLVQDNISNKHDISPYPVHPFIIFFLVQDNIVNKANNTSSPLLWLRPNSKPFQNPLLTQSRPLGKGYDMVIKSF
ncbi:hypothetical protein, partial [Sphingobacterium hotanense]|uniref:hypothetical protein n=1 Tax=Sphingobacterium hotanense TaxID=649196 RepID=UPI002578AD7E